MSSSMKLLTQYIEEDVRGRQGRCLWVFDFDDTLVRTDSKTHVTDIAGLQFDLTPGELALYEKQPGDVFDYSDFERLVNPRPIKWMHRILRAAYDCHGAGATAIVTARGHYEPIHQWLSELDMHGIEIVALGNTSPDLKAGWIGERIERDGLHFVEFFDDSHKNIAAVRGLHTAAKVTAHHIAYNRIASLHA